MGETTGTKQKPSEQQLFKQIRKKEENAIENAEKA